MIALGGSAAAITLSAESQGGITVDEIKNVPKNTKRDYKDNDFFLKNAERGSTLWYQVAVNVRLRQISKANSVLEIGSGRGTTGAILRHIGFDYNTLEGLSSQRGRIFPTLQSSNEQSIADIVWAFQVLEHNSFASFGKLLGRMRDLSNRYVVISLPTATPYFRLEIEPKFWSGYSTTSWSRLSYTIFLPRRVFPRPRSFLQRWTSSTVLAPSVDATGTEVEASLSHLWEVGEIGTKPRQLIQIAKNEGLVLMRRSLAPYSSKQIFLEFEKSSSISHNEMLLDSPNKIVSG